MSLIRGKGETGRQIFAPGDVLPRAYDSMRVERYDERFEGGYERLCVVAHEDDVDAMLAHAAAQIEQRGL